MVKRIFAEYLRDKGFRAIAEELTGEGAPSPVRTTRPATAPAITGHGHFASRAILMNLKYTGPPRTRLYSQVPRVTRCAARVPSPVGRCVQAGG